jgi:hypothetical protein
MKTLLIETLLVFITFILGGILYTLDNTKIDIHSTPPKTKAWIDKNCESHKKFVNSNGRGMARISPHGAFCAMMFARFPEAFIESSSEEKPK